MADVRPFRALRPRDDLARKVIAPPYDVLTDEECRQIARERDSFVRVTRSEVDLPEGADAHSDAAYRKARENLDAFVAHGVLVEDAVPTYYLYGQRMGDHEQVGVLAAASVAEYDDGLIAKHESWVIGKKPWNIGKLSSSALDTFVQRIVGVKLTYDTIRGTQKLSQNMPIEDRDSVVMQLARSPSQMDRGMAVRMVIVKRPG